MAQINLDRCLEQLQRGEILSESRIKTICRLVREHLVQEGNVQVVKAPVTVVGDLHGQFYDLRELFRVGGPVPDTNYLFLGNYVNRGFFSVETISLLAVLKLRYPNRIALLRGSHESRKPTQVYGFYGECMRKYGNPNVWRSFSDMFDYLPVGAVIDSKIFCVHGGLSSKIISLDQIRVLNRFKDVELTTKSAVADLLWSDPSDSESSGFTENPRGVGCTFGGDAVKKFLTFNNLQHIVRSNSLCMDGYQVQFDDGLSTVFSAPNYLGRCGNVAAICEVSDRSERRYNTFTAALTSLRKVPITDTTKDVPDYFFS